MLSERLFTYWDKEVLNILPCRFTANDRLEVEVAYPFVGLLSETDKDRFYRRLCKLMKSTKIDKRGGLQLSRTDRMIIAAPAVILTFGFKYFHWGKFRRVYVYPKAYKSKITGMYHYGETSPLGAVVVSWKRVKEGIDDPDDALHLLYHEYAHALVLSREDGNHAEDSRFLRKTKDLIENHMKNPAYVESDLIREYAFTNGMEFFAVVVEAFIETADLMKERHLELYSDILELLEMEPYESIILKQASIYR